MKPAMPLLIRGHARALPLPDESVDLLLTSPPYWALRSYTDGGEHYDGQIGAESTPGEYLDALIECTREWMRVLKESGSIWLNMGDKYAGASSGPRTPMGDGSIRDYETTQFRERRRVLHCVPNKSLLLLPHRYAIRCVDELGLIVRQDQIWAKPNGLPESVTDRTRRSHEYVFHLVKSPRYYSGVDEIRERTQGRPDQMTWEQRKARGDAARQGEQRGSFSSGGMAENPLGKLPGSVWSIATQPLNVPKHLGVDHFAAMPMELARRIIQGWSPHEICTTCGEGRRPITQTYAHPQRKHQPHRVGQADRHSPDGREGDRKVQSARITGYACSCPDTSAATTPGVIVDPFGGTGTTALVAAMLGRRGISIDLSHDYTATVARWRCNDPKERARAAGLDPQRVSAIKPQPTGQVDMFEMLESEAS